MQNKKYKSFISVGLVLTLAVFTLYIIFGEAFDLAEQKNEQHRIVKQPQPEKAAKTLVTEPTEFLSSEPDTPIDQENTEITHDQFMQALENSRPWLEGRGYFFIEDFVEIEDRGDPDLIVNDYNSYSLAQLKELAQNQDPKGQMYYGLSILSEDLNEGEKWLKESIVSGNYTSAITSIMDAYQMKINDIERELATMRSNTASGFTGQQKVDNEIDKTLEQVALENEIMAKQSRIHAWGIVSKTLKDPFGYSDLYDIYGGTTHTEPLIKESERNAKVLLQELQDKRRELGLREFNQDVIDEQNFSTLINYIDE